jgi:xanthine dehydrogenase YagT iron-sulfur-binding subunit
MDNYDQMDKTTRRRFIFNISCTGVGFAIAPLLNSPVFALNGPVNSMAKENLNIPIQINGKKYLINVDARFTLLDLLREQLNLTGTKKGCDRGQCGACTVLVNHRRVNSCLTLAAFCKNASVITIEGLANGGKLHPVQEAFINHDAFQCGFCTPGQICSAVGLISEGQAKTEADIKELMSGNICRCGAYDNITKAIKEVSGI